MTNPTCWIVDVDRTLALFDDRSPYDWTKAASDRPNVPVVTVVQALAEHEDVDAIVVVSGRPEQARDLTETWLEKHGVPYNVLFLREDGNNEPDHHLKERILKTRIEPWFTVQGVIDDRDKVVRMWREQGLECLQVAPGNF